MDKYERISPDTTPIERPACRLQSGQHALLLSAEDHTQSHSSLLLQNNQTANSQVFQGAAVNQSTLAAGQQLAVFPNNQGSILLAGGSNFHIQPFLSGVNQGGIDFQQVSFQPQNSLFSQVGSTIPSRPSVTESPFTQFQLKPLGVSTSAQNNFLFQPEIKTELSANSTKPTDPQDITVFQTENNEQNTTLQNQNVKDGQRNQPETLEAASTSYSMSDEGEHSSAPCTLPCQDSGNPASLVDQSSPQDYNQSSVSLPEQLSSSVLNSVEQASQDLPDASQAVDTEAVALHDADPTDSKTQSSDPPVVIDEEDILILWNLIGEWKEFKTNGDIARYLLSLYFNPRRETIQPTEKCIHCGHRLSLCCAPCILASKPPLASNPLSQTAIDTSQYSDTDMQDGDDFHEENNQVEAPVKTGKQIKSRAKKAPQKNMTKRTKTLKPVTTQWEKRFNITKSPVVELKKIDADSEVIDNDKKSKVRCLADDGTARYKRSRSTAASVSPGQNEQSLFSKIAQEKNTTASTQLGPAQKPVSKRKGRRKRRTLRKNKPDDDNSEDGCGMAAVFQKAGSEVTSPLNFDSDTDVAEPMQCEDDSRDSISHEPEIPSKTPNTETVSQESSTATADPTTLVQDPVSSMQESAAKNSASLEADMDDEATSIYPSSSSDLASHPGSSQTSTRVGGRTATRSSGPVPVMEEEKKEKYPICDGIPFKSGRITPYALFSEFVCSKCNKTFAKKQEINRHMKTPRCDLDDNIFRRTKSPYAVSKPKPAESDEDWCPSDTDHPKTNKRRQFSEEEESDTERPKLPPKKRYRSRKEYTLEEFMTGKIQIPICVYPKKNIFYYSHYTCSKCCRVFTKIGEHRAHVCDPKFELTPAEGPDPESIEILKKIVERRMFCCSHCNQIFFNKEQHKMHERSHNYSVDENGTITCHFCGEPFTKLVYLMHHISITKKDKKICQECGLEFASRCQIQPHMKEHDKKKPPEPCKVCGKSFECWRKSDITKHLNSHKELRVMSLCTVCGKDVPRAQFKNHLQRHSEDKPFPCSECGKAFRTKASFDNHQVLHGEKQFQCEECGASFFFEKQLKAHVNWNHLNKGFICKQCGKKLSSKRHLTEHISRLHQDTRRFACMYCGRMYRKQRELVVHERVHTGEKPFECQVCKSRFARKMYLNIHMRIHTGEKPYQCDDCGQEFAMRTSYTAHRKARHPDSWVSCKHCGKVFPDKADLTTHCNTFHDTGSTETPTVLFNDADSTHAEHSDTFSDTGTTRVSHMDTENVQRERQEDGMGINDGAANMNFELLFPSLA